MTRRKRTKKQRVKVLDDRREVIEVEAVVFDPQQGKTPLLAARCLGVVVLLVGLVMLVLGIGVLSGRITDGWGFPMSSVPNWGRPWGLMLGIAGVVYVACPILLLIRPRGGSLAMMIVSGLSVLVGTPLITTTTEIFYNLFREEKHRPEWVDSVWGYFIIVHVVMLIAIYKAHSHVEHRGKPAPTG